MSEPKEDPEDPEDPEAQEDPAVEPVPESPPGPIEPDSLALSMTKEGDHLLKRWTLVAALIGVWIPAAVIGLALFNWWFDSIDKSSPVIAALVYVIVCGVAALLAALVDRKPLVAALAIAVMSAPYISLAAAAPVYGVKFCEYANRCLVGVIPY